MLEIQFLKMTVLSLEETFLCAGTNSSDVTRIISGILNALKTLVNEKCVVFCLSKMKGSNL
jgi:hypothetical protein